MAKFLDNIFKGFGYKKATDGPKQIPTAFDTNGFSFSGEVAPKRKISEYLKAMRGWVFSATSVIADEVASIDLKLYKRNGEEIEEIFDHEILNILYKVNNFTTKFDHFWITQTYLELTGECPWYIEKSGGKPIGIYFLKPNKLEVILGKGNQIVSGYKYDLGNNKKLDIPADELIFLKYPDPDRPLRGLGTLEAAAKTVDLDEYAEEWNKNFFFNSAKPSSILNIKIPALSDQQREELKKSIIKNYKGIDKAHKTMILFGDMEWKNTSVTQKDMDFFEQQKFSRDKILGIFRVPKAVVAQTEGVNLASAKTANYIFARWTIKPKMERLVEQLNEFLVPMFADGENLFLDYVSPIPEDKEEKIKYYESGLKNGYLSINEVRNMDGKEPLKEGGDDIYLPLNLAPVGVTNPTNVRKTMKIGATNPTSKKKEIKLNSQMAKHLSIKSKKGVISKEEIKEITEEIRSKVKDIVTGQFRRKKTEEEIQEEKDLAFWTNQIKVSEVYEKVFKKTLVELFNEQEIKTLKKLRDRKDIVRDVLLDEGKETEIFVKVLTPLITNIIDKEGQIALDFIGSQIEFNLDAPPVRAFIKNNTLKFSKEVNAVTNEGIRNGLEEGIKLGEGIDKMATRIQQVFVTAKKSRSVNIARTETIKASSAGTEEAYVQSDIVKGKRWLATANERTCPFCESMNGKTMKLRENFFNKGDKYTVGSETLTFDYDSVQYPPLHPSCRCTLTPIVK